MHLIPVLDLSAGVAVHARGGNRAAYRPVESVLIPGRPGSALLLAHAYRVELGAHQCYVADLDAIRGAPPQSPLLAALADPTHGFGPGLLVDAGISRVDRAREILAAGASVVVVGLETLESFDRLATIVAAVGAERVVFSLDLRNGLPIVRSKSSPEELPETVQDLTARAAQAGARRILILDLARVGLGSGVDLALIRSLAQPTIALLTGGGIRGPEDLRQLRAAGCDSALVGTAIHEGVITATDFLAPSATVSSPADSP